MPNFYSVVVEEAWIIPITPYLKEIIDKDTKETNEVNRVAAKGCLEEFENLNRIMRLMTNTWGQGSFSTSQMKLLRTISAYLDLSVAERRFTV